MRSWGSGKRREKIMYIEHSDGVGLQKLQK
jgi:hypothetical protein